MMSASVEGSQSGKHREGLIAVNYPARKFGINRHCNVTEARKLCPQIICQHVATWKEGDEKWAYHEDAAANIATHKVSLDPYRAESRKILALIKESLPAHLQKVEKASIDEVFCDLSAQVRSILMERYPELSQPPPHGDTTEHLPLPPSSCLDWQTDALVDLDSEDMEADEVDWDDVAMCVGSEIIRGVRARIRSQLGYTCSAGIASNKMLSKLGSGYRKPNQQTVVRSRAAGRFVAGFPLTKIRMLGGKLGDSVVNTLGTESIDELLRLSVEQLKSKFGDGTGTWLYNTIRGMDWSEVNPRTQIKSMLSAKSFRPHISSRDQAVRWLRIFVADIYSRLVDEGLLENRRRPRTINLHHRRGGQTRSRQTSIPQGRRVLDEKLLFDLAQGLLDQIIAEGSVWPCINLSLSVGGFEETETGNMAIGDFLVRGEQARLQQQRQQQEKQEKPVAASGSSSRNGNPAANKGKGAAPYDQHAEKRRRLETGGIESFFARMVQEQEQRLHHDHDNWDEQDGSDEVTNMGQEGGEAFYGRDQQHGHLHQSQPQPRQPKEEGDTYQSATRGIYSEGVATQQDTLADTGAAAGAATGGGGGWRYRESPISSYLCSSCDAAFDLPEELQSHEDWHFAMELQESERRDAASVVQSQPGAKKASLLPSSHGNNNNNNSGSTGTGSGARKRAAAAPPSKRGGADGSSGRRMMRESGQQTLKFG